MPRNSMPKRFWGVQNRSILLMLGADCSSLKALSPCGRCRESTAWFRGLVGSWVRSWMIDIPEAQIRQMMAVGYKKITLGHMKIRIPCSRCLTVGSGVVGVDGFASVDMIGSLRAERSS
jgi:hypothetical protein